MAVVEFSDYRVIAADYKRNDNFKDNTQPTISNEFNVSYNIDEEGNTASLTMEIKVGGTDSDESPFYVYIKIEGMFSYNLDEDEKDIGFKKLLLKNCAAILYPYLRNIVSTITNISNEYPAYILPTINIGAVIEDTL